MMVFLYDEQQVDTKGTTQQNFFVVMADIV